MKTIKNNLDTILVLISFILTFILNNHPYIIICILFSIILYQIFIKHNTNNRNIKEIINNTISNIEQNKNKSECCDIYNTLKTNLKNQYNYEIEDTNSLIYTNEFDREKYINFLKGHL